jgi:S1-C subfamily serine protease
MNHRQIMIVLTLIFVCLWAGHSTAQENLPKLIKRIQPAVVTVIGYDTNGKIIRLGSGFFIDGNGHLITDYHVLTGVARAEAKTADGVHYQLKVKVAEDQATDLVKLVVEGLKETPYYLSISQNLPEVGERVIVVGSPWGLEETVSDGIVSGIRNIPGRGEILQISAPISPGSSGGPVVNTKGEVIGVATFQISRGQNLNFAIPGKLVQALRDFPPRILVEKPEEKQGSQPAQKQSLPPQPTVLVPLPRLQLPQHEAAPSTPEPLPVSPVPPPSNPR